MKTWLRLAAVVAVLAPSVGCTFYFGGDDDPCEDGGDRAFWGYRDPNSGECINFGGGGGSCGGDAVPVADAEGAALAQPNWASCPGVCEGLDEASCQAAPGCRAAYVDGCSGGTGADCAPTPRFLECWGVAQTGPVQGTCDGLDAQGCSEHDDCLAIYYPAGFDGFAPSLAFGYCAPEPTNGGGCYSDAECGAGFECTADTECLPPPGCDPTDPTMGCPAVCYGRCVPSTSTCDAVDCGLGSHCEEVCTGTGGGPIPPAGDEAGAPCLDENGDGRCDQCLDNNGDGLCDEECFPVCVPDTTGCEAIDCGPGFVCDLQCFPCDPLPDGTGCPVGPVCEPFCRPIDPPNCGGIMCPTGSHCQEECLGCDPATGPGCTDVCRATCVPDEPLGCAAVTCAPGTHCEETCFPCDAPPGADCAAFCDVACVPDAGPVCETITDEMTCIGSLGCTPVYWGDNCTCDASGVCTCTTTEFARCETGGWWDPPMTGGGGTSGGQPRVVPRPR